MLYHTRESSFPQSQCGAHQQERHRDGAQNGEEDAFNLEVEHPVRGSGRSEVAGRKWPVGQD